MPRDVYIKKPNGRYERVGAEFKGFRENGIWLVEDGMENLIMKVGDLPDPMPLAQLERIRDDVISFFMNNDHVRIVNTSYWNIVEELFKVMAKASERERDCAVQIIEGVAEWLWEHRTETSDTYDKAQQLYRAYEILNRMNR